MEEMDEIYSVELLPLIFDRFAISRNVILRLHDINLLAKDRIKSGEKLLLFFHIFL